MTAFTHACAVTDCDADILHAHRYCVRCEVNGDAVKHVKFTAIARLVETGREDKAREAFGDQVVDDWFRADGWNVEAACQELVS